MMPDELAALLNCDETEVSELAQRLARTYRRPAILQSDGNLTDVAVDSIALKIDERRKYGRWSDNRA